MEIACVVIAGIIALGRFCLGSDSENQLRIPWIFTDQKNGEAVLPAPP